MGKLPKVTTTKNTNPTLTDEEWQVIGVALKYFNRHSPNKSTEMERLMQKLGVEDNRTNADVVREMSNPVLADFLIHYKENPCMVCPSFRQNWTACFLDCKAELKKWLNAKAKE